MMPETIETDRLILRPLRPSDAGPMALYAADRRVAWMTTSIPHPYPPGAADAYIASAMRGRLDETVWAIDASPIDGGELVGIIAFRPKADEIGYWVGPPFWNTGYASEALSGLIRHLFAGGVERLAAHVIADNPASAHVLGKAGFVESAPGEQYSVSRGSMVPLRRYSLARADWKAAEAAGSLSGEAR